MNEKSVAGIDEYGNGWLSGPVLWDYLSEKYLGGKPTYSLDKDHMDRVWKLAYDQNVEDDDRIALIMTFDYAYVGWDNLARAAEACAYVHLEITKNDVNRGSNWSRFAETLLQLSEQKRPTRFARGVALSCTSVSDPWEFPSKETFERAWEIPVTFEEPLS